MHKEIPYLHYIRVVACFMVVMLHCLPMPEAYTISYYFTAVVQIFTRPCVPLFFMVSGVLLLPYKGNSIKSYYKKRLTRIAFPLLFWGIIYAILPYFIGIEDISEMLGHLCLVPLTYPPEIGGILWFMYIILGIYMIIPFINPKVFDSKKAILTYMGIWCVSMIVMFIQCYHPQVLGMTPFCDVNMLVYFSGYLGYLFLGKYLHQYYGLKYRKYMLLWMSIVYVLCMLSIIIIRQPANVMIINSFLTIPAVIMSAIIFIFFKEVIANKAFGGYLSDYKELIQV